MNGFLYCLFADILRVSCIAWLGWVLYKACHYFPWYVSTYFSAVMLVMALFVVYPSTDIFTCPKCGWVGKVKTFRQRLAKEPECIREDKGEEMELQTDKGE